MRRQPVAVLVSVLAWVAALILPGAVTSAPPIAEGEGSAQYMLIGPKTWADRNAVAATGAAIDNIEHGKIYVTATFAEIRSIKRLGFQAELLPPVAATEGGVGIRDFPPADSLYHNYAQTNAELLQIVADHGSVQRQPARSRASEPRSRPSISRTCTPTPTDPTRGLPRFRRRRRRRVSTSTSTRNWCFGRMATRPRTPGRT